MTELNCFNHYRDTFKNLVVHKRTTFKRDAGTEKKTRRKRVERTFYIMLCLPTADCRCRMSKEK